MSTIVKFYGLLTLDLPTWYRSNLWHVEYNYQKSSVSISWSDQDFKTF